jgi:hypothetical protein
MWKQTWMLVLAAALCGCFKTKDELTINADGSGAVRLETRLLIPSETLQGLGMGMGMGGNEGLLAYPPTSEAEAKRWFPAKDFKITTKEDRTEDGGSTLVITAEFKDVNGLLASPYAKAHGLTLAVTNDALSLKAVTGIEAAARLAEMKDDSGMFGGMMASMEVVAKKKDEMRTEFRVTLPNAVSSANAGGAREGKTVAWTVDRAKQTNAAEFAQQAGAVLEASCSAEGVKFSPVTPARLSALPFKDAPAGAVGDKVAAPDTNKIAAAAKFVPLALQVTRSIDLSGEGGSPQNQAQLVGTIVLPREFAPQKWGEAKLDEVVDEKGNNLKFEANDEASRMARSFGGRQYRSGDDEDGEEGGDDAASAEARHTVTLSFQPPDWKVREIARVKGSIPLHYFGGAQVVKLSNTIPEKWIRVMTHEADVDFDPTGKSINDPTLPETGLSLSLTMGAAQGPMTTLMIQAGGNKLSVTDGQVYDAAGRPWPTFFQKQGFGEEGTFTLMVAGRPAAPLSLALVVSGVGASVDVPFLVEKVPLRAR